MQSGRILPAFRAFLSQAPATRTADRDPQSQRDREDRPNRQPTKEEALEAMELLSQQEFFQRNGLRAELAVTDQMFVITVKDEKGNAIRSIRGPEILRLLDECRQKNAKAHLGSILDRRI